MFLKGFVIGVTGMAAYMAAFQYSLGAIMRSNPRFPKLLYALSYVARYFLLGVCVYFFLKYKLGSILGLLAGIIAGTLGYAQLHVKKIKVLEQAK